MCPVELLVWIIMFRDQVPVRFGCANWFFCFFGFLIVLSTQKRGGIIFRPPHPSPEAIYWMMTSSNTTQMLKPKLVTWSYGFCISFDLEWWEEVENTHQQKMRYDSFRNKREIGSNGSHKVTISAFAQPYSILNEPYHKTYHLGIFLHKKVDILRCFGH